MDSRFSNYKQVDLREIWKNEATDFTEWLSHKENLDRLASELQIPLEFAESEKPIGNYAADIVAKIPNPDSENEELVVIENQLEDSDHDHLGKLITYAAGVDAKVVILICKDLREEHQTAVDWLNEISSTVKFFVVKIEVFQLDDSKPYPKFTVVCKPDYWAKNIKQSVESTKDLTETTKLQKEFWEALSEFLKNQKSNLKIRKVYPKHWCEIAIGTSKGHISFTVDTRQTKIGTEFYSSNDPDKRIFNHLQEKKQEIEKEMGSGELLWMELPNKKASRVKIEKNIDITDKRQWNTAFEFFKEEGEKIQKIFPKHLKDIDES